MAFEAEHSNYKVIESSLEKLALREIVVNLWKSCDVMTAVADESWKFYSRYEELTSTNKFKILSEEISVKVDTLFIPPLLAKKVKRLVVPIGLHLCEWIDANKFYIKVSNLNDFLSSVHWTPQDSINRTLSVETWIRNSKTSLLFELACQYCVETQVERLWSNFTTSLKDSLFHYVLNVPNILLKYWVLKQDDSLDIFANLFNEYMEHYHSDGYASNPQNIGLFMAELSLTAANFCVFKHFYSKLTPEEKVDNAMNYLMTAIYFEINTGDHSHHEYLEIVFYLHSQLTEDQRKSILYSHSNFYLYSTVVFWQYHNRLASTITILGDFLTVDMYCNVLINIAEFITEGRYVEEDLIEDVWYATSVSFKRNFFQYVFNNVRTLLMFEGNIIDLNRVILTGTTIAERNELYSYFEI